MAKEEFKTIEQPVLQNNATHVNGNADKPVVIINKNGKENTIRKNTGIITAPVSEKKDNHTVKKKHEEESESCY